MTLPVNVRIGEEEPDGWGGAVAHAEAASAIDTRQAARARRIVMRPAVCQRSEYSPSSNRSRRYCPAAMTCSSSIHTSQSRVSTSTWVFDDQSAWVWLPY